MAKAPINSVIQQGHTKAVLCLLILTCFQLLPTVHAKTPSRPLRIAFVRFSKRREGTAVFRLRNVGAQPLQHTCYRPEEPLYAAMVKRGVESKDVGIAWCGTGAARNTLEGGESIDIQVNLDFVEKTGWVRIGIDFYGLEADHRPETCWSGPLRVHRS